jgi:hypothetical protein
MSSTVNSEQGSGRPPPAALEAVVDVVSSARDEVALAALTSPGSADDVEAVVEVSSPDSPEQAPTRSARTTVRAENRESLITPSSLCG